MGCQALGSVPEAVCGLGTPLQTLHPNVRTCAPANETELRQDLRAQDEPTVMRTGSLAAKTWQQVAASSMTRSVARGVD